MRGGYVGSAASCSSTGRTSCRTHSIHICGWRWAYSQSVGHVDRRRRLSLNFFSLFLTLGQTCSACPGYRLSIFSGWSHSNGYPLSA